MKPPTPDGVSISHAMEDYLKAIYQLATRPERVTTSEVARHMGCTPASVTNMLQKLSGLTLVEYAPYQGVVLTETGTRIALQVIRHHRLIELYLSEVLGFSWDKVHEEAERLEHVISEEFEEKIDAVLGHPKLDPHGDPIPTKDGRIDTDDFEPLWEAPPGSEARVMRVSDRDPEALRYLASLGIYPDVVLEVGEKAPFNGPLQVVMNGSQHALSEELSRQIYVSLG